MSSRPNNEESYEHDHIESDDFFANLYPNTPDKRSKTDDLSNLQGISTLSTPFQPPSLSASLLPSPFPLGVQSVLGSPVLDFSSGYSKDWGDYLNRSSPTMSPCFAGESKQKRDRKNDLGDSSGLGQSVLLKGSSGGLKNAKNTLSEVLSGRRGKPSEPDNFQHLFSEEEEKRLQQQQQLETQQKLQNRLSALAKMSSSESRGDANVDDDEKSVYESGVVPADYMGGDTKAKTKKLKSDSSSSTKKKSVSIDKLNKINDPANGLILMNNNATKPQHTADIVNDDSIDLSNINITSNKKIPKSKSKSNKKILETSTNINDSIESSSSSSTSSQVETTQVTFEANATKSKPKSKSKSKSKANSKENGLNVSADSSSSANTSSPGTSTEAAANILLSLPTSPIAVYPKNYLLSMTQEKLSLGQETSSKSITGSSAGGDTSKKNKHSSSTAVSNNPLNFAPMISGTSDSDVGNSQNSTTESIKAANREISANAQNRNQYMQEKIQANLNNIDMDSSDLKNESSAANCKCRKTKCLKLYCDCFKIGLFCEGCDCTECYNKPGAEFESIRKDAMEATLGKNPVAFKPRVMEDSEAKGVGHVAGCRCKRSNCLKKYCECFNGNAVCIPKCRCVDCKNKSEEFHENNRAKNEDATNQNSSTMNLNMSQISGIGVESSFHQANHGTETNQLANNSTLSLSSFNDQDLMNESKLHSPKKNSQSPVRITKSNNSEEVASHSPNHGGFVSPARVNMKGGRSIQDMGSVQQRSSFQSSLISSTDGSTSVNLDMSDSMGDWMGGRSGNNKSINTSLSADLLTSLQGDAIAISSLIISPTPTVNKNTDSYEGVNKTSNKSSSYMMDTSTTNINQSFVDNELSAQHLQNTDSNLSFQSVGSSGSNNSYMSANFKPAILRQPSSTLTTSSKKRRSATKSNIDSIIQSISASKKKSDETTMSSPMTKLIELAGLCEDRGHGGAEETLLSLSPFTRRPVSRLTKSSTGENVPSDGRSNLFSSDNQQPSSSTTASSVCEAKSTEIEEPISSSASSEVCQEKSSKSNVPITPAAKGVEETVSGSRRSSRNNRKSKNDN